MVAPVTPPEGGKPLVAQPIYAEPENIQRMAGERLQEEGVASSDLLEHAFSTKDVPVVSQRQLGRIMQILKRDYCLDVTDMPVDGSTGIDSLVENIAARENINSCFLDQRLSKEWFSSLRNDKRMAIQVIMAAALKRGQGVSTKAAIGLAELNLAQQRPRISEITKKRVQKLGAFLGVCSVPTLAVGGTAAAVMLGLGIAVPPALIGVIIVGGVLLGAAALCRVHHRIPTPSRFRHRKCEQLIKNFAEKLTSQSQMVERISRPLLQGSKFSERKAKELFSRNIFSDTKNRTLDEWKAWCNDYFEYAKQLTEEMRSSPPLVIETSSSEVLKSADKVKENLGRNIECLAGLKWFLDPPREGDAQRLQLDWHTPGWTLIREKLARGEIDQLKDSVQRELKRMEDASPRQWESKRMEDGSFRQFPLDVKFINQFIPSIGGYKRYLDNIERALWRFKNGTQVKLPDDPNRDSYDMFIACARQTQEQNPLSKHLEIENIGGPRKREDLPDWDLRGRRLILLGLPDTITALTRAAEALIPLQIPPEKELSIEETKEREGELAENERNFSKFVVEVLYRLNKIGEFNSLQFTRERFTRLQFTQKQLELVKDNVTELLQEIDPQQNQTKAFGVLNEALGKMEAVFNVMAKT